MNIFVMKYRMMMNDIHSADKMFGIVMSDRQGGFCQIGTCVEICRRDLQADGQQLLLNVCRQRFRILNISNEEPYMIANVEYGIVDDDVAAAAATDGELPKELCDLEKEVYQALLDVVNIAAHLKSSGDNTLFDTTMSESVDSLSPKKHPFRLQVASDFSFAICDMLGVSPRLRQLLLEAQTLKERLEMLKTLLVRARTLLLSRDEIIDQPFN